MPAGLLTKYRPQVPILTVLVPTLKKADGESWMLEGRGSARQCLLHRGLMPLLAQPSASGMATHLRPIVIMPLGCLTHLWGGFAAVHALLWLWQLSKDADRFISFRTLACLYL